ncbi:hypothetical protein OHA37_15500 [Streptomyces sp. NBC_00335]|uniref:hypothetical protein n=1 Tax=unclassified Streptomyces TaxID=2593676 RepID=UPI002256DC7D|nr:MULTISPECIES: hypothetical protein [unclassified Streptomyces]MCX5405286.1 hypothetical protein [Streptomyces sp. NBC_00086]
MPELLAALFTLIAQALAALNPALLVRRRRRLARLADHAQGLPVLVPCDLRDRELTGSAWSEGHLKLPLGTTGEPVRWLAEDTASTVGSTTPVPVDFPPLEAVSADELSVAFRSADGATELRLHPDEAPMVLRVLRVLREAP